VPTDPDYDEDEEHAIFVNDANPRFDSSKHTGALQIHAFKPNTTKWQAWEFLYRR
jgi:hypothetical protein